MIQIRPLLQSDLPLVRTWMRAAPEAPAWSEDDLLGLVNAAPGNPRKTRRAWVVEDESGLAGFAVATALSIPHTPAEDAPAECELELVLVPAHARRRGIGGMLVQTVLAWARDQGATEIWLEMRESNMRAVGLYQRCGFTTAGRRPGYYVDPTEDALLMRLRIECDSGDAPV
jgi:[ribosomal protein S18]-alanine N-acetyltransferase